LAHRVCSSPCRGSSPRRSRQRVLPIHSGSLLRRPPPVPGHQSRPLPRSHPWRPWLLVDPEVPSPQRGTGPCLATLTSSAAHRVCRWLCRGSNLRHCPLTARRSRSRSWPRWRQPVPAVRRRPRVRGCPRALVRRSLPEGRRPLWDPGDLAAQDLQTDPRHPADLTFRASLAGLAVLGGHGRPVAPAVLGCSKREGFLRVHTPRPAGSFATDDVRPRRLRRRGSLAVMASSLRPRPVRHPKPQGGRASHLTMGRVRRRGRRGPWCR
jgi:hypothetical protein